MSYEVRTISKIDNKNIKLGKTFKYSLGGDSNYHLTNIYYTNPNINQLPISDSLQQNNSLVPKEIENKKQDSVDEKTKLIIQTPLMYIPNSMIYFNEKPFLELSFNNEDNDKDVSEFKLWISNLEDYIFKLIKKRTTLGIEKSNLCSILKVNNHNSSRAHRIIVPININISKCILNNDINSKKSKILFNWEIPVPTYGLSIIWVKNIWVKNKKWGINLFMYTSRVMNSHILDPIDFMGLTNNNIIINNKTIKPLDISKQFKEDKNTSIQIGQVPEYSMYFKMLKMGIPKDAVKQKMLLLGLDTKYIDFPDTTPYITVIHYISNPHLDPYIKPSKHDSIPNIPTISIMNPTIPTTMSTTIPTMNLNLLANIGIGGFKLKKVNTDDNIKNKIISGLIKSGASGLKVPSLGDIQGALSRLKKVDLDLITEI